MSLFRRVFLPCALLLVLTAAVTGVFGATRIRASYLDSRRQALGEQAWLAQELVDGGRDVRHISAGLGERVTVIADDGTVTADSTLPSVPNVRLRPEIVEASARGQGMDLRRDESGAEVMYVAVRTRTGFLRLASPVDSLNRETRTFYVGVGIAAGSAILICGLACFWFARRHAKPIARMTDMAQAFARGEFGHRSGVEDPGETGTLSRALNAMADSIVDLIVRLRREKDQLQTILSGMNEGVIATDRQQRVILSNRVAAEQLGFDAAEGKPLWEIVRQEQVLKAATEVLSSGAMKRIKIGPIRGRQYAVSVCPYPDPAKPEGLVLVSHDTTEADRYEGLRTEFVANVSHELRTPLTMIRGFVETLRDGALKDPVKGPEFLAIIEKHVRHLGALVDELLDLSALESRPGLPNRVRVDLKETVDRVVDLMRPAAEKKRQSLTVEVAGSPHVAGDPHYLERAVSNLVDNAIKYTPQDGTIRVATRAEKDSVVVEVIDNGIGIPAEDLPRVFERFYRVDKSRSREMGGSGLGLSIVKHIVQAHEGRVEAASAPGRGSTFRMIFPGEGPAAPMDRGPLIR